MRFHEKLDFLMNITKTSNSALSLHTALDASHISRLRRGERKLVKEAAYLKTMSEYFARQCREEHQKKALMQVLNQSSGVFRQPQTVAEKIYNWFLHTETEGTESITEFLDGISKIQWNRVEKAEPGIPLPKIETTPSNIDFHYGKQGKREAVRAFLSIVNDGQEPATLLLYSDESMDWLIEDYAFMEEWQALLSKAVMQGNRIKIIHTVSRNLHEMLEAISKWMPLHLTGAVEPYYYPKKRDGVFKRTLFVAPNRAAVTATSTDIMTDSAMNLLIKDPCAINALEEEFFSYLNLCKPLMRIFTNKNRQDYYNTLIEFETAPADSLIYTNELALETMPLSVANKIIKRSDLTEKEKLMHFLENRIEGFEKNLLKNQFFEVIQLPEVSKIKDGKVQVSFFSIQEASNLFYEKEDYRAHLENIIMLLERFDNYQAAIRSNLLAEGYKLYAKEDLGILIFKTTCPHLSFVITESNMTAAFWDYLGNLFYEDKPNKKEVIHRLQEVVDQLK